MHSKFDNIEIMINDKADEVIKKSLNHLLKNNKTDWKNQREVVRLSSVMFIYCVMYLLYV